MAELIVVAFEGIHRASEVIEQLGWLNPPADLKDAVAVFRTEDGRLHVAETTQPTRKDGATLGAVVGAILGAIITAPLTGGASTGVAATAIGTGALALGAAGAEVGGKDAKDWKEKFGISEEFVQQIGGRVQPGQSAVFVLVSASEPANVAEFFRGCGGRVLWTTLPPAEARRLQHIFDPTSATLG